MTKHLIKTVERIRFSLYLKLLAPSLQVAPFLHGSLRHSSMFFSHRVPQNPGGHLQKNLPTWSSQTALFKHGLDWHSLTSVSQCRPGDGWKQERAQMLIPRRTVIKVLTSWGMLLLNGGCRVNGLSNWFEIHSLMRSGLYKSS